MTDAPDRFDRTARGKCPECGGTGEIDKHHGFWPCPTCQRTAALLRQQEPVTRARVLEKVKVVFRMRASDADFLGQIDEWMKASSGEEQPDAHDA